MPLYDVCACVRIYVCTVDKPWERGLSVHTYVLGMKSPLHCCCCCCFDLSVVSASRLPCIFVTGKRRKKTRNCHNKVLTNGSSSSSNESGTTDKQQTTYYKSGELHSEFDAYSPPQLHHHTHILQHLGMIKRRRLSDIANKLTNELAS